MKKLDRERSKREDIEKVLCPKCKKPMGDRSYLMMGVDKACDACNQKWHHRMGYNPTYR